MKKSPFIKFFIILALISAFLISCTVSRPTSTVKSQNQPSQQIFTTTIPVDIPEKSQLTEVPSTSIYLIALEDNGKSGSLVGCGDSLVAVKSQAKDARAALQLLLENRNQYYGQSGLYNALYQSKLNIERFESKGGETVVDLAGNIQLGGVCDNPRLSEQLKATIRQSTAENLPVFIRINGTPLEDVLSQK